MQYWLLTPGYLAFKEVWRNRGRFALVSLVIALITVLVLFIAALGEGLGNGNREYVSKLNAQLIVYQAKSDFLIAASRLGRNRLAALRRVDGVTAVGALGTANATLIVADGTEPLKVALLGVEPGRPGEPAVVEGRQLSTEMARELIIDRNVALRRNIQVGDEVTLRVTQGIQDQHYTLRVVGLADGQQYSLQPSIFASFYTWERVRPKSEAEVNRFDQVANVALVQVADPAQLEAVRQRLLDEVPNIEVADVPQAIEALPGYTAQQGTLNTQGGFTLLIGVLVIGGFFQIQILQKVPQIGVLKAIGAPTATVGVAAVFQIVLVTALGVAVGGLGTYLLSLSFPPTVPIAFNGSNTTLAVLALLVIGPLGGLVSIRYAMRIEPLKALGLSS